MTDASAADAASRGQEAPLLRVRPPGPESRSWNTRARAALAPMGPRGDGTASTIVLAEGRGVNLWCVDGNRYVDLAAGFGALPLGHGAERTLLALELQSRRLQQGLGDLHPTDARVGLASRLSSLRGGRDQVILGVTGADAVTAALETALLCTGKAGVLAFEGSYHGLSYAPLAVTSLRESYRAPFASQLNAHVAFAPFPRDAEEAGRALDVAEQVLRSGDTGAVIVEPVQGRGGARPAPPGFLAALSERARARGALLIVDEIWTGLGRTGAWLAGEAAGVRADLVTLGKSLGGGLPISACLGASELMSAWSRQQEVVTTSTFAGAPLAAATALATLDVLHREALPSRAATLGSRWLERLREALEPLPSVLQVRGAGLLVGVELAGGSGAAVRALRELLAEGFVATTGGGHRETLVLTPALVIEEALLDMATEALARVLGRLDR